MARIGKIEIDREMCKGCGLCVRACHKSVIELDTVQNKGACHPAKVSEQGKCSACGGCRTVCPDLCISVYEYVEVKETVCLLKGKAAA
jgi:2-oxoglutarate ferredoxin oxidoreductase subunit delta